MAAKPETMAGLGLADSVLPPEIWRDILARLPVKSILRCKSVCKSWYSLVSCPDFITHHSITNLHNTNGNRVLFQVFTKSFVELFSCHDESCMESGEHDNDCPNQFLGQDLVIVGSCNGLICLSRRGSHPHIEDTSTMTFLIWNPAIRKSVELRSLNYFRRSHEVSFVGFGFDSHTSDYKVMFFLRNSDNGNNYCEVIDLKKGVWRRISPLVPPQAVRHHKAECYVNGALHWSLSRYVKGIDRVILSFNMSDESFREIRMPDCEEFMQCGDDDRIEIRCLSFGGLLHVIVWKIELDDDYGFGEWDSYSVWAMKEYGVTESWIKVSNIDLQSAQVLPCTWLYPKKFILWAKCEILMLHCLPEYFRSKQDLVLYNTESRKSKHVNFITDNVKDLCHYKESLVLMRGEG